MRSRRHGRAFIPETIAADVSAARLTRFFSKDDHGYRILPELRATIVFAVQDVLADPPFSRLDLVSCRNLLIYLRPEAQEKVISFFHFALREGGILLLGSAETIGSSKGRFEIISKAERIYRHIGRSRPGEPGFLFGAADGARPPARAATGPDAFAASRACRGLPSPHHRDYAPAAVLINRKLEWLYSLGPTERYLRVPTRPSELRSARDGAPAPADQAKGRDPPGHAGEDPHSHSRWPDELRRQAWLVRDRGATGSDRR